MAIRRIALVLLWAILISIPETIAQVNEKNQGYLVDQNFNAITSSTTGLCWRSSDWTSERTAASCNQCDAALCQKIAAPKPEPERQPQLEAKPEPKPSAKPGSKPESENVALKFELQDLPFNRAELTADNKKELDYFLKKQVRLLDSIGAVIITGHSDRLGSDRYNIKLSQERAKNAMDYLVSKGVDRKLIVWEGIAAKNPIPGTKFCDTKMRHGQLIECLAPDRRLTLEVMGTRPQPTAIPSTSSPNGEVYQVWYATNRQPILTNDESKGYANKRDSRVHYGKLFVVIPDDYLKELRKRPAGDSLFKSPERVLKVRNILPLTTQNVFEDLRQEIESQNPDQRDALIYLHGFNTSFEEAAQRAAAIGYAVRAMTAFFSWPSANVLSKAGYRTDLGEIEYSEDEIMKFILQVVRESGATHVHLVAHSMGNYGLLHALLRPIAQAAIKRGVRFENIILAAPDVDKQTFIRDAAEFKKIANRITLYVSSGDRALRASKDFRLGSDVAGLSPPVTVVPIVIDSIDASDVDFTVLGHAYVASSIAVLADINTLIWDKAAPDSPKRFGLKRSKDGTYWEFK